MTADKTTQVIDAWFEEIEVPGGPAELSPAPADRPDPSTVKEPTPAIACRDASDSVSEHAIEGWFEDVAATNTSLPEQIAAQSPEGWFEEAVDGWFGEVDNGFEQLAGPLTAARQNAPQPEATAAVIAPAAPVVRRTSVETVRRSEAPEAPRAIRTSGPKGDPALALAESVGSLEAFNADLRRLGPRIRRAEHLLRAFTSREPAAA